MELSDNDILLSAYLDGELTADERAQVDQLLATRAEARQLVEDLRALRAGLQELPQHKLDPDFAQTVLARAEQAASATTVDSTPHSDPMTAGHRPQDGHPLPTAHRPLPTLLNRRGLMWSLVAL